MRDNRQAVPLRHPLSYALIYQKRDKTAVSAIHHSPPSLVQVALWNKNVTSLLSQPFTILHPHSCRWHYEIKTWQDCCLSHSPFSTLTRAGGTMHQKRDKTAISAIHPFSTLTRAGGTMHQKRDKTAVSAIHHSPPSLVQVALWTKNVTRLLSQPSPFSTLTRAGDTKSAWLGPPLSPPSRRDL